ncbi:MAG: SIR2 family protein, partial [Bryobacteraceae bacterium]
MKQSARKKILSSRIGHGITVNAPVRAERSNSQRPLRHGILYREAASKVIASLPESPSRSEVLEFIFNASKYGNLGLFVGAGFSKAILNDDDEEIALSWGDLLEAAAKRMHVHFKGLVKSGMSYPEVASALCRKHAEENKQTFQESVVELKDTLAASTAWFPEGAPRTQYASYLRALLPRWIVTTNYDQILECLLSGRSVSLGPNDTLSAPTKHVPIYHLHGCRTRPSDIIITQEDYVALF